MRSQSASTHSLRQRPIPQIRPQVIELGPPNASIHKIDEHIELSCIEPLKNIYRRTLANVHVRCARSDLSRVDLVDSQDGSVLCAVQPLDKAANANGVRRRLAPASTVAVPADRPAWHRCCASYWPTTPPPAYLPVNEEVKP